MPIKRSLFTSNHKTMEELIKQSKYDPEAFSDLYHANVKITYHYLYSRLQNRQEAEDLTSTAWEAILKNISQLKTNKEAGFKCWLFTIVRNTFYNHLEKNRNADCKELSNQSIDKDPTPDQFLQTQEDKEQINIIIDALPPQQKEIVCMHFFADLKNKEIASILNISEKTVASNLSRAVETLRQRWKKFQ